MNIFCKKFFSGSPFSGYEERGGAFCRYFFCLLKYLLQGLAQTKRGEIVYGINQVFLNRLHIECRSALIKRMRAVK